jgi:hypothetical protein
MAEPYASTMSLIFATQLTAVATTVLAVFAIVTAIFAILAFLKQTTEVATLQQQAKDQQDLTAKQTPVLELQVRELEASLAQRKDQAESERRAQANRVAAWFAYRPMDVSWVDGENAWGAVVRNDSDLPVLSVRVFFHYIQALSTASEEWEPVNRGGPLDRIRVVPPRSEKFIAIPDQVKNIVDKCNADTYAVGIQFTDAAGNRWERNARGSLEAM